MELIKISDTKLKITLTREDMAKYELDCDTIDYDNTETRKAFWNILDHAKHITGFDAASERVFIQLYPDKTGGCEMYVTKLGLPEQAPTDGEAEGTGGLLPMEKDRLTTRALTRPVGERERLGAYRFASMERLLCVCRQLSSIGYPYGSSAYRDENGSYYLLLREKSGNMGTPGAFFSFISEFGTPENPEAVRMYIGEHGYPVCEGDAVGVLARF